MTREFKFYKTEDNRWWVDLPEWDGEPEMLEMVMGADILLEILARENDQVYVKFGDEHFENSHTLTHTGDGYYDNDAWHGPGTIWLCAVTEFVFGTYPEKIYYSC